jgi:uncharacterized membrane protein
MVTLSERKKSIKIYFVLMNVVEIVGQLFGILKVGLFAPGIAGGFILLWIIATYPMISMNRKNLEFNARAALWGAAVLAVVAVAQVICFLHEQATTAMFIAVTICTITRNWLSAKMFESMLVTGGEIR